MKVLVFNCGSSTLKFEIFQMQNDGAQNGGAQNDGAEDDGNEKPSRLGAGLADRIGQEGIFQLIPTQGPARKEPAILADHREATRKALDWLESAGLTGSSGLDAVGHRVVHGGARFREPVIIDDSVLAGIEEVTQLAPLHNGPSLQAIRAVRDTLGNSLPMVAVFDTAFHRSLPMVASRYAIPQDLAEKHHIQRYGFHGIAHRYMAERYAARVGRLPGDLKLITLQLGNGCSAAAVAAGRSVDTSMGLTPLEGLIMGTRSGDVDPSLPGFLARREGVGVEEVDGWLNQRSGLLGLSGRSQDMRELLHAEQEGDAGASVAIDMFCYRARKYVGAYLAVLGGADAVIFGGGIGENAPAVRERICAGMDWCGLILDPDRNAGTTGREGRISAEGAGLEAYVIPVDEASIIARETRRCLAAPQNRP